MKLLLAASGDFAMPTFSALAAEAGGHSGGQVGDRPGACSGGHRLVGLITQPDRGAGRGRQCHVSRIKIAALELGLPVLQPERIADPAVVEEVRKLSPDLLVVMAYGQKIPPAVFRLPPRGTINLHGSLLPVMRGAAPCNWAVIRGLGCTGVTVQELAEKIDSGRVIGQREALVGRRETAERLSQRLAELGAGLVLEVLGRLDAGTAEPVPQDEGLVTVAPRLRKEDGLIDWAGSAGEIDQLVRGLQPWPGAYTYLRHPRKGELRIILQEAWPQDHQLPADLKACPLSQQPSPGTIMVTGKELIVVTGQGYLNVPQLKPDSGKVMTAEAFCNGYGLKPGDMFIRP